MKSVQRIAVAIIFVTAGCASLPGRAKELSTSDQSLVSVAEQWWRAMTLGDTTYVRDNTSQDLELTLSNGRRLSKSALVADVATHRPKSSTFVSPSSGRLIYTTASTAVVQSTVKEGSQGGSNEYHYLTVFGREGSKWVVVAAQSTRVLSLAQRVSAEAAGDLTPYEGEYRGGRGGLLRVIKRGQGLILIDPEGAESVLEPIGPGIFELPKLYDGIAVVRFVFSRDDRGAVTALSRLIYGSVTTWQRAR